MFAAVGGGEGGRGGGRGDGTVLLSHWWDIPRVHHLLRPKLVVFGLFMHLFIYNPYLFKSVFIAGEFGDC